MLWVVFALLTAFAIFSVLRPLGRAPRDRSSINHDIALYRAQIDEITREQDEAGLAPEDIEAAKAEAARRLINAAERADQKPRQDSRWRVRLAAGIALVAVPLVGVGLYTRIGHPGWPDEPLLARLNQPPDRLDIAAAIAKVEAHLAQHPDDKRGYDVLIPIYLRLGRFDDAARTAAAALKNLGETPQRLATYGETLVAAAQGRVTDEANGVFAKAAAQDPPLPEAQFYLGLAAAQKGDNAKAKEIWTKLLDGAPKDAPWRSEVQARLESLTGASAVNVPQGGEAIAALPAAEREQAIRGMVAKLAAKLEANGQDLDGWLRLVRAYKVLNDVDKARAALATARKNFDNDSAGRARIDALARELGLDS